MDKNNMTLKEVAELLHQSQSAVRSLVTNGQLAARRVGRELQFERADVDRWQSRSGAATPETDRLLPTEATGLPEVLTVTGALALPRINLDLKATSRDEVLRELVALVVEPRRKRMAETFFKALKAREEMCSTCVDEGVAIPHSRNAIVGIVDQRVLAYGRHVKGLEYGALDGQPVHHFFLLCAPNVRDHLQLLSRLARLLKRPGLRDKLMLVKSPAEMLRVVRDYDISLG